MAPRTRQEREVAEIWQEMLGVAQVGVIDNFFSDLGGSSMLAAQLIARLRERFQVELPLRRLFEGPTVAELAAELAAAIDPPPASDPGSPPSAELLTESNV